MCRFLAVLSFFCSLAALEAADAGSAKEALRVLRDECLGCHKPGKAKGGLLLNSREKLMQGGDSGAAVLPGKPEKSLLYEVLLEEGDPHMPPKKQLDEIQMAAFHRWILEGAVWDAAVFDELPKVKTVDLAPLPASYRPVLALALSPDEKTLAVAAGSELHLHDLGRPGKPLTATLEGHVDCIRSVAWSADGRKIYTGSFRQIFEWNIQTGKAEKRLEKKLVGPVTALALQDKTGLLFAADGDTGGAGFIHQIRLEDLTVKTTWKAHEDAVFALCVSPDGQHVASAGADKMARLWKAVDGGAVTFFEGHTNHILSLAFNKDGSQLATAGADREVKVWDVKSREQDVTLGDKKTAFTAVAWTPDGRVLAAVTEKGTGSLYSDLKKHDGAQRSATASQTKLGPVSGMLYSVVLTADGKLVFAGSDDGQVWMWDGAGKSLGKLGEADS